MAREGLPFLAVLAVLALVIAGFGHWRWSLAFLVPMLFVGYFFRDPKRTIPTGEDLIVSPADGKVIGVGQVEESPQGGRATKISIFLNIFNVHINRSPVAGRIERIEYRSGRFLAAFKEAASEQNERNTFIIDAPRGRLAFSQVAGLIARRIVCWKKESDSVATGDKVGMIMFGSRVDLYLPPAAAAMVKVGDLVKGGESVVGRFSAQTGA